MAETYKELQDINDSKFQQDPSTASSKGSGFKEAMAGAIKVDTKPNDSEPIDYKKVSSITSIGQSLDGGVSSGLNANTVTANAPDAFDTKVFGINIGTPTGAKAVYDPFNGFNINQSDVDTNMLASTAQSNWSKTLNLGTQFIGKTAVNTVGGIAGGFYSVGSAIAQGDSSYLTDNSVNRALDSATEAIERGNTINTHRTGKTAQDFFSFNTIKGLGDASSFIAGAVASELVMQSLGNVAAGSGIATSAARWSRLALKATQIGKPSSRVAVGLSRGLSRAEELLPLADEAMSLGNKASKEALNALDEVTAISQQLGYSIDKLRDAALINQNLKAGASFLRSTVTSTFWEAGLEARQAKESFISNAMQVKQYELDTDPNISEEDKGAILQAYNEELKEYGDKVSMATFMGNAAVLKIGNVIQFPTLFGNKYVKKLNQASKSNGLVSNNGLYRNASGTLSNKTLKELAVDGDWLSRSNFFNKLEGLGLQAGRVSSNIWKYVQNPLTEAGEEYSQYLMGATSSNYYNNVLNANVRNNPETERTIGNLLASLKQSFGESTKNNAWDEAIIGGIMGAMGIPMFRKGANGKREFQMEGGIWQAKKSKQAREFQNNETIRLFDTDMWNEAISTNLQKSMKSSTIEANTALSRDQAVELADQAGLTGSKEDALFNNITDKLLDGSIEFLQADVNDIKNMSLEDFTATFINQEEIKNMTAEEKKTFADNARNETLGQIETYVKAFETVTSSNYFGSLMSDMSGSDLFQEDLLKMLTYSIAKADIKSKQISDLTSQIVSEFNGKVSNTELNEYAKLARSFQEHFSQENGLTEAADLVSKLNTELENINESLLSNKNTNKPIEQISKELEKHSKVLDNIKEGVGYSGKSLNASQIKSQSAYRQRLINKLNEVQTLIEDQKNISKTTEQAEKDLQEIIKKTQEFNTLIEDSMLLDINTINKTKDGAINSIQSDTPVVNSDVKNYIRARANINNMITSLEADAGLTLDSFKALSEEQTTTEKLNLLASLESDRIMHQRVAAYFYKRMANPGSLIKSMFKANADTAMSEILKDLSLLGSYISSNTERDTDFIEERLTAINTNFEELEGLIEGMKARDYDIIEDNPSFKEVFESAKSTLNSLKADYQINTQSTENTNDALENLITNELPVINNEPEIVVAPDTPATSTVNTNLISRANKANRLVLSLFGNDTEQKRNYLDAIDKGLIKSGRVVVLDSVDDSHETDDWFSITSIDKKIYNKGKELVKADPSIIDKAFSTKDEPLNATGGSSSVSINGSSVDFNSPALINTIKNYKESSRAVSVDNIDERIADLQKGIQGEIDTAFEAIQGFTKGTPEYKQAMELKADKDKEMRTHLNKLMDMNMWGKPANEVFPELFTSTEALKSSPEAVTIAETIISQNNEVLKLVSKEQLVDMVVRKNIKVNVAPTINSDIPIYKAIRYYVSNYRLYSKFTDKPYNDKNTNIDDVNYTYTSFLPAVEDLESESYLEKIALQIDNREVALKKVDIRIKELTLNKDATSGVEIHKLNKEAIDLIAEIETLREQRNDRTNLEFRKEVLKRGPYQVKLPTVNQGNIAGPIREDRNEDGSIKSESEINSVKEFLLMGEDGGEYLIDGIDDFISKVVYKTSNKETPLKNIYNEAVLLTTAEGTSDTMSIEGVTGDMFYIYTDRTGKNVPIKLNSGTITDAIYSSFIIPNINKYYKGIIDVKELKSTLSTFIRIKTKNASKTNSLTNSVTILTDKDSMAKLIFIDREGNKVELDENNYDSSITTDLLKDIVTNSRANVFIGNMVDSDGNVRKAMLSQAINSKLINTDKDVSNNFDKVYQMDENGEPKISITITPSTYEVSENKLYNPTKRSFLKSFKQAIDNADFDINAKNIKDKLSSKVVFELTTIVQQDIKKAITEAPDNIKEIYNNINDPDKLLVEDNVSKEDRTTYNKYIHSIVKNSIDRYFNTNNPNFKGGTIVSKINGLIRYYPSYYTTDNPDLTNTLNFAINTLEEFKTSLLSGSNIYKLIDYSSSMGTRSKIVEQINKAASVPRRNKHIAINTFDSTGKKKHNPDGVSAIKLYVELASKLNYSNDTIIPIATQNINVGKDKSYPTPVKKAISLKLDKNDTTVTILYNNEAHARNANNEFKYSFKEQRENGWKQQVNIDDIPNVANPTFFTNLVIPNLSNEDMEMYLDIISRGSGQRTELMEIIKKDANTKELEQSMLMYGEVEVIGGKAKEDKDNGIVSDIKDIKFPELKPSNFVPVMEALSKYIKDKDENANVALIMSDLRSKVIPSKILAYIQVYSSIIKNQGEGIFGSDNITIPEFTMGSSNVVLEMTPSGPDFADIFYANVSTSPMGSFTRKEFMESDNEDIKALRAINDIFESVQSKADKELTVGAVSFEDTVVSEEVKELLPIEVMREESASVGGLIQTPIENSTEWFTFETKGILEKINSLDSYKDDPIGSIKELKETLGDEKTLNDELKDYC